jgi:hypothetical protein
VPPQDLDIFGLLNSLLCKAKSLFKEEIGLLVAKKFSTRFSSTTFEMWWFSSSSSNHHHQEIGLLVATFFPQDFLPLHLKCDGFSHPKEENERKVWFYGSL